jgi:hypothetical protein
MKDDGSAAEPRERKGDLIFTQASESVSEEMEPLWESESGASATEQAIAISLSRPSEAMADLSSPKRRQRGAKKRQSHPRSRTIKRASRRIGRGAANRKSLSGRVKKASRQRGDRARSRSAKKAGQTRKKRR